MDANEPVVELSVETEPEDGEPVAWRLKPWAKAVSLSESYVHLLIRQNRISSVKAGSRRLITVSPREYLEALSQQDIKYTRRGRPVK